MQELIDVLTRIATSYAAEHRPPEASNDPVRLAAADLPRQLAEPVADILRRHPSFVGDAGYFVREPSGAVGFRAEDAAAAMVRSVLGGESPGAAVSWLKVVLDARQAEGVLFMALWGVTTDGPIELSDGIQILPLAQLPQSYYRDRLLALLPEPSPSFSASLFAAVPPSAALTMKVTVCPVLIRSADDSTQRYYEDDQRTFGRLDGVRLALSAIGPSAPLTVATWFEYDSPAFRWATAHEGISSSWPYHEIAPLRWNQPVSLEPEIAAAVVHGFLKLENTSRDKVLLALQRLNQAVRRHTDADRALELGIALEAILTDEHQGESTYKFGLRSALLTPGTREQRLARRHLMSALYTLRSAVVHNGTLPETVKVRGSGKTRPAVIIEQGLPAVAEIVREVIRRGAIPKWAEFELEP